MAGFALDPPDDAEARELLQDLPGLVIQPDGELVGRPDAISAASVRLGGSPLVPMWRCEVDSFPWFPKVEALPRLRDYQRDGVAWMYEMLSRCRGGLLADDMGLGKTTQAIALMMLVCGWPKGNGRALICCPASVRETWAEEMEKMGVPSVAILRPKAAKGSGEQWAKSGKAKAVVTSYDLAPRAIEAAFSETRPLMVVLDEAHLLKGRHTQRSNDVQAFAAFAPYRLALTATPQYDRPRDLFKLMKILLGSAFGSSWDFDRAYCAGKENEHGGMDNKGVSRPEELKHRMSFYMVRREKKDVLAELPPLTRQVLWIDPDPKAQQWFRTALTRRQSGDTHSAIEATLKAKMDVALQLARDAKRFLLFTKLRSHARQLSALLNEEGTPNVCITGDDTTDARNKLAKLAEAKGWGVVATIDSLSVGVNLQSVAEIGIFHCLDYVPQKMAQAEARLHRMGQRNAVTWYWLAMKDSIDELIVREVVKKLGMWTDVMGKGAGTELRDKLNAAVGVGEQAEKEALSALYASME